MCEKIKIKKCPFCGSNADVEKSSVYDVIIMKCTGVGCYTKMSCVTDDVNEAIEKWNKRADQ